MAAHKSDRKTGHHRTFWDPISWLASSVAAAIAGVLASLFSEITRGGLRSIPLVLNNKVALGALAVLLLTAITAPLFVLRRMRRSRQLAAKIARAYQEALKASVLNPHEAVKTRAA